jgi:AcrR family transcriptional regulator
MSPHNRREALLDAAATIVASDGVAAVTMDTVAEAAGVSRPLVYRYFPASGDILAELYARELTEHDAKLAVELQTAATFEDNVRALIRVWLETFGERGAVVGPLFRAEAIADRVRQETRKRDHTTIEHFSALAMSEFGMPRRVAVAGVWMQLGTLQAMLHVWAATPRRYRRSEAAAMYVAMVMGAWRELAALPS